MSGIQDVEEAGPVVLGPDFCISRDVKCVGAAFESIESGRNILRSSDIIWLDFQAEIASSGLNVILLQHGRGIAGGRKRVLLQL